MPFIEEEELKREKVQKKNICEEECIKELRENIINKKRISRISSVVSYKERGHWGSNKFRGNTTGYLLIDLFNYYLPNRVFDPMEGSGTTRDICKEVGKDVIEYEGRDLITGFNLLDVKYNDMVELRKRQFNCIFLHPPYWKMVEYWKIYKTDKFACLSGYKRYADYLDKLFDCIEICCDILPKNSESILILQLGDYRKDNVYYPIVMDIYYRIWLAGKTVISLILKQVMIKVQNEYYKIGTEGSGVNGYNVFGIPIIPIQHEYVLIFEKV